MGATESTGWRPVPLIDIRRVGRRYGNRKTISHGQLGGQVDHRQRIYPQGVGHGVLTATAVGGDHLDLLAAHNIVGNGWGRDVIGGSSIGEVPLPSNGGRIGYDKTSLVLQRTEHTGLRGAGYPDVRPFNHLDQFILDDGVPTAILRGSDELYWVIAGGRVPVAGVCKSGAATISELPLILQRSVIRDG